MATTVTAAQLAKHLDRVATLIQDSHVALEVPARIALDFATRCDHLSDFLDGGRSASDDSEKDDDTDEVEASSKKATDETGLSVEPVPGKGNSYDPNDIGDEKAGPLEIIPPREQFMDGHFTQKNFQQLREKVSEGAGKGTVSLVAAAKAVRASILRKASVSALASLEVDLKTLAAQLAVSPSGPCKALAADVDAQAKTIAKMKDLEIEQLAAGPVDPALALAAERAQEILGEEIPFLVDLCSSADPDSPISMLDVNNAADEAKDLVQIVNKMLGDATKPAFKTASTRAR